MSETTFDDLAYDDLDGTTPAPAPLANGELVHWMDRPPLKVGAAGVGMTAGAAFAIGAAVAVGVLALLHLLGPERTLEIDGPRLRRRG